MYSGFTFIEVVIALFLLSIMTITIHSYQTSMQQSIKGAYYYSLARVSLENYLAIARISNTSSKKYLLNQWQLNLQKQLPNGRISFQKEIEHKIIIISWGRKKITCAQSIISVNGCLYIKIG